ncbi:MAG: MoaD family protein [Anaerolineales bacterium]
MPVKVRGYLTYKLIIGEQSITLREGETLTLVGLLTLLAVQSSQEFVQLIFEPEAQLLSDQVTVLINGRSYTNLPDGLETNLKDGDEVSIFPPIAGGSGKPQNQYLVVERESFPDFPK